MGLIISQSICSKSNCRILLWGEGTGTYNASINTTGWGAPNPLISDVSTAVLTVKRADGNSYDIDVKSLYGFPSDDVNFIVSIPYESIGYTTGDKIPDQIMTFTYTVTMNNSDVYVSVVYKPFTCSVKCCVDTLLSNVDLCCDECANKTLNKWISAWALYQGLLQSACEGNIPNFNNQLAQLNKMCKTSGCSSCN